MIYINEYIHVRYGTHFAIYNDNVSFYRSDLYNT